MKTIKLTRCYNEAPRDYFGEFAWINCVEKRRKEAIRVAVERWSSGERRAA